ncbi:MAG: cyclic nucleotide-binding domain-containing protein [Spirochaetes bacterium]|nr:cyclic nucleotide-binding domain-containing protein [Spirochaetota bacterium]
MALISKGSSKDPTAELLVQSRSLKKDEILYKQGDSDTDMFILNQGKCGVYVDDEFITEIQAEGAIIGESAALFKYPRSATIIALEDSELAVIPGEYIDKVILENPKIGLNLVKTIAQRLHHTSKLAANLQKLVINYKNQINVLKGEKEIEDRYKLGRLFYETGILTKKQLKEILNTQKKFKLKGKEKSIGQILIEKKYANMFQVMQMIHLQNELKTEEKIVKKLNKKNDNKKDKRS